MKYTHTIETAVVGSAMSHTETTIIETPDPPECSTTNIKFEIDTSEIQAALAKLAKRGKST